MGSTSAMTTTARGFNLSLRSSRSEITSLRIASVKCKVNTSCLAKASVPSRSRFASGIAGRKSGLMLPRKQFSTCSFSPRRKNFTSVRRPRVVRVQAVGDSLATLGYDLLTFLGATVVVVPLCNRLKISPILGFLVSGFALDQAGVFTDESNLSQLSELGVLFLLFEMGLELSTDRLKALAKYAFGLGVLQLVITASVFTGFELPVGDAIGSGILEKFFNATPNVIEIRSIIEAVVIGSALSLSSSAFVLQLLAEKGDLTTRYGSATLGILLMQDIAVVPLLVLLPLIVSQQGDPSAGGASDIILALLPTFGTAIVGVSALFLVGRVVLRYVFELVAESKSNEAFVSMCLLTVLGTSLVTKSLGLSDSLGAFIAGVLLAETNFRNQVEADIRPFRGLLLGLFFVTTGTEIDADLLIRQWPTILALTAGLITIKSSIIISIGPVVGLTRPESIRTGLILSQGGEFAFVLFTISNQLGILPEELNRLLIVVVILTMVMTPALYELGKWGGNKVEEWEADRPDIDSMKAKKRKQEPGTDLSEPIVVLGFNQSGQVLSSLLAAPTIKDNMLEVHRSFVAFDFEPKRIQAARSLGLPVYYGDGSDKKVLKAAGITQPAAVCICFASRERSLKAVERLRDAYGASLPIYARAHDMLHAVQLEEAGATKACSEVAVMSMRLGTRILKDLGAEESSVRNTSRALEDSMWARARSVGSLESIDEGVSDKKLVLGSFDEEEFDVMVRPKAEQPTSESIDQGDAWLEQPGSNKNFEYGMKVDSDPSKSDCDVYDECDADYDEAEASKQKAKVNNKEDFVDL